LSKNPVFDPVIGFFSVLSVSCFDPSVLPVIAKE
jgi:hypothetical protein